MATVGMLKRVHTIKSNEIEQLVNAFEASEKWLEENVKENPQKKNYKELQGDELKDFIKKYKWDIA